RPTCNLTPAATPLACHPTPGALPAPTLDRIGFPDNYLPKFAPFYVENQFANRQIRTVYANDKAASVKAGEPYPYGSVLVGEFAPAKRDAQGLPELDANGRFQREGQPTVFVMCKEPGFGVDYKNLRNGEWEYVAYRPDRSIATPPTGTFSCAACHLDAGQGRDWVFRTNLFLNKGSGAIPKMPTEQSTSRPTIDNYFFLPDTIRVKVGTSVTWTNNDDVPHTVTALDGSFSSKLNQGTTFSRTFDKAGTFEYQCAVHPTMLHGKVIVE